MAAEVLPEGVHPFKVETHLIPLKRQFGSTQAPMLSGVDVSGDQSKRELVQGVERWSALAAASVLALLGVAGIAYLVGQ